jgi:hypothetical protein
MQVDILHLSAKGLVGLFMNFKIIVYFFGKVSNYKIEK